MEPVLWIEIAALCLLALLPVAWAGRSAVAAAGRNRRMLALALHREQLREIERDRADGLIEADERDAARLEVQRRLLVAADGPDEGSASDTVPDAAPNATIRRRGRVWPFLLPVPVAALALYLQGGHPALPPQPMALRMAQADRRLRQDDALVATLRQGLARLDPAVPEARRGYLLLGEAEASRGNWAAAAAAWGVALGHGFDPTLAVQVAEAQSRADGAVSPASAALFRRALDAGPPDAPWRSLAEQRLAQSEHR